MMSHTPLKIAILSHFKHPIREPFAGGLEAFTYDVTLHLRRRGHDVTLFAHADSAPELKVTPLTPVGIYRTDATRHDHDTLSSDFIAEHHAYMDCMQQIDNYGFDIIFNNALHYVPVTMAGMINTPMLTVLHTPPFFEMIHAIAAQHKRGGGEYCTVSRSNAVDWGELTPDCYVISNGIDLDQWRPTCETIGGHAFWYGRLVADKGLHLAIDAARLAGVSLRFAGQMLDPAYFDQEIAPRLADDIVYLGHLSRSELVKELGCASVCLVTPCWNEPFGLVVIESLACGTPVAAFSRGEIPDLLSIDTGALATPGDPASLAAALLSARLLDRAACRSHAQARWGIDSTISQYEDLLASLARVTDRAHG